MFLKCHTDVPNDVMFGIKMRSNEIFAFPLACPIAEQQRCMLIACCFVYAVLASMANAQTAVYL